MNIVGMFNGSSLQQSIVSKKPTAFWIILLNLNETGATPVGSTKVVRGKMSKLNISKVTHALYLSCILIAGMF